MNRSEIVELFDRYVVPSYARYPHVFVRGKGARVWDADGREYLDFGGGIAVNLIGHSALAGILAKQAGILVHASNLYYTEPQGLLAKRLVELVGIEGKCFFCNSGGEANEALFKLARKYGNERAPGPEKNSEPGGRPIVTLRYEILTFESSFHGRTLAGISATGQEKVKHGFEPMVDGFRHVPFDSVENLRQAISSNTCAVMLEPIQGEGGIVVPSPGYFRKVREICNEHELLLIFDEVQVGMGRTGKLFAHEHFDVIPDIMTLAKALAGGAPIGAMLAKEDVAASFGPGTHGSTFGGNPLVTAAGVATLQAILNEGILKHTEEMGKYLLGKLKLLQEKFSFISEVRGIGLMIGMDLSINAGEIVTKSLKQGLLLNVAQDSVLRFLPPLIVTSAEIDEMLNILEGILAEV